MNSLHKEPQISVAGRTLFAICKTSVAAHRQNGCICLAGHKSPIAIILRDGQREHILHLFDDQIGRDEIKAFLDATPAT